jgi:hypothetical protein
LNRLEGGRELPLKAETLWVLQALDQLRDMPGELSGKATGALLLDGIRQLRGPAAEIYRLALADEAT